MPTHHVDINDFFQNFPNLEAGPYLIRELRISDAEQYYNIFADPNVAQYLSEEDVPGSIEEAEKEIRYWSSLFHRRSSIFWGIAHRDTDELIGTIGFNNWSIASSRAEISYDLNSKYWRRGIMNAVLSRILEFSYLEMGLYRIEARTMLHNAASSGLLLKNKFQKEGIERGYRKVRGQFIDVTLFGLTAPDWMAR